MARLNELTARVTTQETANGQAYTYKGVIIIFPDIDRSPWLVFGDSLVTIDYPERFGAWGTRKQRETFMRQFVDARLVERNGWFVPAS